MRAKSKSTCNNDNYSDWRNTWEVRCQPTGPTALRRAEFYCFLHGNCFPPALFCSLLTSPWNESIVSSGTFYILQHWSHEFLENLIPRPPNHFLNGNQMTKLTSLPGQIMSSIKVLRIKKKKAKVNLGQVPNVPFSALSLSRIFKTLISPPSNLLSCW